MYVHGTIMLCSCMPYALPLYDYNGIFYTVVSYSFVISVLGFDLETAGRQSYPSEMHSSPCTSIMYALGRVRSRRNLRSASGPQGARLTTTIEHTRAPATVWDHMPMALVPFVAHFI